ncbi:type II toxin-antitoxin system VapC family toxin [Sphingomonas sp. R86521]|uniref:type II toxin-antitoxin system VapC family toxin n=1 Tax=Sphingomonas sp. R86521 TaxID=3093860 RepID=UPI0036D3471E
MIAVDTNIVLRLILNDDAGQIEAIRALMKRNRLFVSLTVLLETGWVLESRYRMPRHDVAAALDGVVALEGVAIGRPALAAWAVDRYRAGGDWADMIHLAAAAKTDGFATLDRRVMRHAGPDSPIPIETLA